MHFMDAVNAEDTREVSSGDAFEREVLARDGYASGSARVFAWFERVDARAVVNVEAWYHGECGFRS